MTTNAVERTTRMPAQPRDQEFLLSPVNIFETQEGFVIEAEMPGVPKEGLEITMEGNTLTLTGRREVPQVPGEALYVESRPMSFQRAFELEPSVDPGKVTAQLTQGVVRVTLPKSERVKPRQIKVTD